MKISVKDFFTFTKEIINRQLYFWCCANLHGAAKSFPAKEFLDISKKCPIWT